MGILVDSDWTEIWSAGPRQCGRLEPCLAIDPLLGPRFSPERLACYVKYEFQAAQRGTAAGLDGLYLEMDLQMAATALPSLAVGRNEVLYRDDTQGDRNVRIAHGWRESSATRPPAAPSGPITPGDGSAVAPGSLKKFAWSPAEHPDGDSIAGYHIQVSPRDDFLYPVSPNFDRLSPAEPEWAMPEGWLIPGQTYYWRVRARDAHATWSPWSRAWRFRVNPAP